MIDTIIIRLSNVTDYPLTKLRFEQTGIEGRTIFEINEDTGEFKETRRVRALLHHDSDNIIPLSKRNSMFVPSSNYSLSYKYNIPGNYIDFEFSIPKYLYGSNILQFIKYFGQDPQTQYTFLMNFIKGFIKKISFEPVRASDVLITRLDMCYNQFFASKFDALKYLNEQKALLTKYARSTKNDYRSYESSLVYITKRYSFKIYHKGTEFKKNDRVKLLEKNPTGENIDFLQETSDRILRYEVTFRKAQIDYLFREKQMYQPYVSFMMTEGARRVFGTRVEFTYEDGRKALRVRQPEIYKSVVNFCERGHDYILYPIKQYEAIQSGAVLFSQELFTHLYDFFWNYVKKYQLQCKMSVVDLMKKVDEKNEQAKMISNRALRKKTSVDKSFMVVLALLTQSYSLDELRKSELLGRSTFYKYQKKLKDLGFTSQNKLIDVAPPTLDYLDYLSVFGRHHRL